MASPGGAIILGGKGMLGIDLAEALRADGGFGEVIVADRPEVDIAKEGSVRRFFAGRRPAVVLNCAAITDVDGCETRPDEAFAVNAEGAGRVARAAAEAGARLIHLSTDFVFDGRKGAPYVEEDAPAPLSAYGRSKLEGERLVAASGARWTIARTAWLYGRGRKNFVDAILALAREREEVAAVSGQVGSPTWTRDLAAALTALARSDAAGVFHVVNSGQCSRLEWTREICRLAGARVRLREARTAEFPQAAARPAFSALSVEKLRRVAGHVMRPWQEALREYLRS